MRASGACPARKNAVRPALSVLVCTGPLPGFGASAPCVRVCRSHSPVQTISVPTFKVTSLHRCTFLLVALRHVTLSRVYSGWCAHINAPKSADFGMSRHHRVRTGLRVCGCGFQYQTPPPAKRSHLIRAQIFPPSLGCLFIGPNCLREVLLCKIRRGL